MEALAEGICTRTLRYAVAVAVELLSVEPVLFRLAEAVRRDIVKTDFTADVRAQQLEVGLTDRTVAVEVGV